MHFRSVFIIEKRDMQNLLEKRLLPCYNHLNEKDQRSVVPMKEKVYLDLVLETLDRKSTRLNSSH